MSREDLKRGTQPSPEAIQPGEREKILIRILYQAAGFIKSQLELQLGLTPSFRAKAGDKTLILGCILYEAATTMKQRMEDQLGCGTGKRLRG